MDQPTAKKISTTLESGYDAIAEHFAETRMRQWYQVTYVVDQYVQPGQVVLDAGCGSGRLTELIDERKARYIGVDPSSELLAQGNKRYPGHDFRNGSMQSLPVDDQSVDVIFAIASFHHVPSRRGRIEAMNELSRVLKPGGRMVLFNWNRHQWRYSPNRWRWNLKKLLGRSDLDWNDVVVPWKNSNGTVLAERYYHSFTKKEMARVARAGNMNVLDQYYELHGMHVPRRKGQNLVTVLQKPA